jgi:hypothetical protein
MGFFVAFFVLLAGALTIATASIGLDCINKRGDYTDQQREANKGYLTVMLALAIGVVLVSFYLFYDTYSEYIAAKIAKAAEKSEVKAEVKADVKTDVKTGNPQSGGFRKRK